MRNDSQDRRWSSADDDARHWQGDDSGDWQVEYGDGGEGSYGRDQGRDWERARWQSGDAPGWSGNPRSRGFDPRGASPAYWRDAPWDERRSGAGFGPGQPGEAHRGRGFGRPRQGWNPGGAREDMIRGDSDVPGYGWRDAGAGTTTGRDEWTAQRGDRGYEQPNTSEQRRTHEHRPDPEWRPEPGWSTRGGRPDTGRPMQRFGDGRYGRPDEWSSQQSRWPGRPSRYEDANSGFDDAAAGSGMGGGMYWSGESAREDDMLRRDPGPWRGQSQAGMGRFAGRGPRNYRRSSERIAEDVSDRLTDDPWVDASDIVVTIQDAVVVLEGAVDSRDTRRRAEDIALSVSGVIDVMNHLKIDPNAGQRDDRPRAGAGPGEDRAGASGGAGARDGTGSSDGGRAADERTEANEPGRAGDGAAAAAAAGVSTATGTATD